MHSFHHAPKKPKRSETVRRAQTAPARKPEDASLSSFDDNDDDEGASVLTASGSEDSPFCMFFVRVPTIDADAPTDDELRIQAELFQIMARSGIDPEWRDADECFHLSPECKDFFIVPAFRGETFKRLVEIGLRLYGTSIAMECVSKEVPLPRWDHPVFSNVFEGTRVCFSGILSSKRVELREKVMWMNGIVTDKLYTGVTHLVTNKADTQSEKYMECSRANIPVMKEDWIVELWEKTKNRIEISALHTDIVAAYKLPLFHGLSMTISGVTGMDRVTLGRLLELHGGHLLNNMPRARCTHLLCDKMVGEKYKKAVEWGTIRIVQTRWLRRCVDSGSVLDERKYHPRLLSTENIRSSTPVKEGTAEVSQQSFANLSSISGIGGRLNQVNASSINCTPALTSALARGKKLNQSSMNTSSQSNVQQTTINTIQASIASKPLTDAGNVGINLRTSSSRVLNHLATSGVPPKDPDPTDALNLTASVDFDFLEGCLVWLCGVDEKKVERWRKILDRTGATRVQRVEAATHVVVVSANKEQKATLRKVGERADVVVVTPRWIVACFDAADYVSPEEYFWSEEAALYDALIPTTETPRASSRAFTPLDAEPQDGSKSEKSSKLEERAQPESVKRRSQETLENLQPTCADSGFNADKGIFGGLSFRMHGLMNAVNKIEVTKLLKDNGGVVRQRGDFVQYVVFDDTCSEIDVLECTGATIVSEFFVRKCVEDGKMHLQDDNPFFLPLPEFRGPQVFKGVVAVIEGFGPVEKAMLTALLRTRGAHVQEVIAIRAKTADVLGVTHLFPAAKTERVEKAQKTRIRIVDVSWIIECIVRRKTQPEDHYLFNERPFRDYKGRTDKVWEKCSHGVLMSSGIQVEFVDDDFTDDLGPDVDDDLPSSAAKPPPPNAQPRAVVDYRQTFKMNLNLDGVNEVIDQITSPSQSTQDISLSTTRVGRILHSVVERTSVQKEQQSDGTEAVSKVFSANEERRRDDEEHRLREGTGPKPPSRRLDCGRQPRDKPEVLSTSVSSRTSLKRQMETSSRPPSKRNPSTVEVPPNMTEKKSSGRREEQRAPEKIGSTVSNASTASLPKQNGKIHENEDVVAAEPGLRKPTTEVFEESFTTVPDYTRRIIFSGFSGNDRNKYTEIVTSLEGRVDDSYHRDSTHLICDRMLRGHKQLSIVAAGKWCLVPEYLDECAKAGHWLPEVGYEWCESRLPTTADSAEMQLAACCRKWRHRISAMPPIDSNCWERNGAFLGWRCVIHTSDKRSVLVIPILTAGGATITTIDDFFDVLASRPKFVFAANDFNWNAESAKRLKDADVPLLNYEYIFRFLVDESVDIKECKHPSAL